MNLQLRIFSFLNINRLLRLIDRRGRLYCRFYHNGHTIADTPVNTAVMIGCGTDLVFHHKRVVCLTAKQVSKAKP